MSDLPFGIDISRWNSNSELTQHPDFDTMVRGGVRFVAMRAGISWGYKDPTFDRNWQEAKRIRLPRIAYHVPYFHQSIENQVDHFLRIVEGAGVNWKNDRLALDLEVDGGQPRAKITDVTCGMMERLKSITERYPILYSRASWVDTFMAMNELLADADWWLAQYYRANPSPQYTPEYPSPPRLPKGINHWLIHQTAEKGNGGAVGVISYYVDTNRWNGTMDQMRAWFGLGEEEPEPEPPEIYFGAAYWQRDARWRDMTLGTKSTIGAHGCLMVCNAMHAVEAGHTECNPVSLNRWLIENGGYDNGNLFIWKKLTELYPDMEFLDFTWYPTDDQIKQALRRGELVSLLVDFDETTPEEDMHWVKPFLVDNQDRIWAIDPWRAESVILLREVYKKPFKRYGSYRKAA